jgi:S1-C subfamily serine protease
MRRLFSIIIFSLFLSSCETIDPTIELSNKYPWPIGLNKNEFVEKFFKGKNLDEVEGVYAGSNNTYEIAVIKNTFGVENEYDYLGIITDSAVRSWKKGEIKFKLKKTATPAIFTGNFYMGDGSRVGRTFFLKKGYIEVSLPTGYYGTDQAALFLRSYPVESTSSSSSTSTSAKKTTPSSGSAFFVDNLGHVITNYHVIEKCGDKSKIIYNGSEYSTKLIAQDKYLDLALLKADLKNNIYLNISSNPPKKLDKIIAAGYPFGKFLSDDLKFTSGIISSIKGLEDDSTRIQIDAALNPGNSGGPIVNESNGELVAVAASGLRKDLTESVNFGIKAAQVKVFLESNQIVVNNKKNNKELSELLEEATVYTFCK